MICEWVNVCVCAYKAGSTSVMRLQYVAEQIDYTR